MSRLPLNYGTVADDGTGDVLFDIFDDIEANILEIFNAFGDGSDLVTLATVAVSGDYGDLSNTPTIPSSPGDIGAATAAQGTLADSAVQPGDLDDVAFSGDSDDLTEGSVNLLLTPTERTKLTGIEDGATADQTGAEIKALYEAESNTNAFTDDEKTKLAGITAGATAWDAEQTRDTIGNTLNGTTDEVTVTPDDGANTITAALAAAAKASLALADTAVQPAALADYVTKLVSINPQTGTSYTLVLADQSKMVTMNNGSANTLTVPTNASVALPVGTLINVTQLGRS